MRFTFYWEFNPPSVEIEMFACGLGFELDTLSGVPMAWTEAAESVFLGHKLGAHSLLLPARICHLASRQQEQGPTPTETFPALSEVTTVPFSLLNLELSTGLSRWLSRHAKIGYFVKLHNPNASQSFVTVCESQVNYGNTNYRGGAFIGYLTVAQSCAKPCLVGLENEVRSLFPEGKCHLAVQASLCRRN